MAENKLIAFEKINIFKKIKNFIFKIAKKEREKATENTIENTREDMWEMYQKAKAGAIDIKTIDFETMKKFCVLIQEEIQLKKEIREEKIGILESL